MKASVVLVGKTAWQEAKHKALYGRKTWIAWIENDTQHAQAQSYESVKRAMLATGTKGRFYTFSTHGMSAWIWGNGVTMLNNLRRGYNW